MNKLLVAAAMTCSMSTAFADDIRLGLPAYGGNGCPQGSASAALSPDHKSLSILFDQFSAEAGMSVGKTVDRKACNIAIPIHIPNGYSIALFAVDYRGFNAIPDGAYSRLNVDYFFAGSRGPSYVKSFYGPDNSNYLVSNALTGSGVVWSPCGADTNLRINASIMAQTNYYREQTLSTVDSADIKSGLVYHIQYRTCR